MGLAIGAKKKFMMMERWTKSGESKIVERCTCRVTGIGHVTHICTDLAVVDVTLQGLRVVEDTKGLSLAEIWRLTAAAYQAY